MKHLFMALGIWTVLAGCTGCVVKEREYPHEHHERVYIEHPRVEEKVIIR